MNNAVNTFILVAVFALGFVLGAKFWTQTRVVSVPVQFTHYYELPSKKLPLKSSTRKNSIDASGIFSLKPDNSSVIKLWVNDTADYGVKFQADTTEYDIKFKVDTIDLTPYDVEFMDSQASDMFYARINVQPLQRDARLDSLYIATRVDTVATVQIQGPSVADKVEWFCYGAAAALFLALTAGGL